MNKIAIAIHGGAGADSEFIRKHKKEYESGLKKAVHAGYTILEQGGKAVDAVEAAVNSLEDNPLFNAGKGSALNERAEIEMCASIMDGQSLNSGAAAIVKNVRNPVSLAKTIMEKTRHVYLGATLASEFAKSLKMPMEPDSYFVTEHQFEAYEKVRTKESMDGLEVAAEELRQKHGTVGAVALDKKGNLAAGTSSGGTEFCKAGRIADSSMVGIGTYADNESCAISTTGDGEELMKHIAAFHIAALLKYKKLTLQKAADYFLKEKLKNSQSDIGLVGVDRRGNIVATFNCERMHRAWKGDRQPLQVNIY
ncbi:MAG TPA: isoaspartyl peptidase/L-asparaginase [Chitinophagaceae bacterium]|nr:isoaspartyl peptidase/L-asparaginase [Chitinophagaceae bacterium]